MIAGDDSDGLCFVLGHCQECGVGLKWGFGSGRIPEAALPQK